MLVKDLEAQSGVSRDTLRFYEREALISPPKRRGNGYREYDAHNLAELKFIAAARAIGFTLQEIKLAIPKLRAPPDYCPILMQSLQNRRDKIEAEIAALKLQRSRVDRFIERFGVNAPG